jgi:hypothetical protein
MEQASAKRDLLRTPSAIAGPTEPSAGTPAELVFGFSSSVADIRKASLTMKAAQADCKLFLAANDAQQRIQFS